MSFDVKFSVSDVNPGLHCFTWNRRCPRFWAVFCMWPRLDTISARTGTCTWWRRCWARSACCSCGATSRHRSAPDNELPRQTSLACPIRLPRGQRPRLVLLRLQARRARTRLALPLPVRCLRPLPEVTQIRTALSPPLRSATSQITNRNLVALKVQIFLFSIAFLFIILILMRLTLKFFIGLARLMVVDKGTKKILIE